MFDVDADLVAFDEAGPSPGAQWGRGRRPRFPPSLSGVEAYTREIDHSIVDTHL